MQRKQILIFCVLLSLCLGAYLRFAHPYSIEFKFDESETLNYARDYVKNGGALPWLGQRSSNGLTHPGFGLWPFLIAGRYFVDLSPEGMARVAETFGILAILALIAMALTSFRGQSRNYLLQAACLMAVNPFWVLQDRKAWHPVLLGLFVVLFLWAWRSRHKPWPAFFAGFFMLIPGQVHMSGFFMLIGFFSFTCLGRIRVEYQRIRMLPFMAGAAISALPLVPWLYLLLTTPNPYPLSLKFQRLLSFKYFNYWFSNSHAVLLKYPFGKDTLPFLQIQSAAIVAAALLILIALLLFPLHVRRLISWRRMRINFFSVSRSELSRWEFAMFWGVSLVSIASLMHITRYFSLCAGFVSLLTLVRGTYHLEHWLKKRWRVPLGTFFVVIFVLQATYSIAAMRFVDKRVSRIRGDYGRPWHLSKFPNEANTAVEMKQNEEDKLEAAAESSD